MRKMIKWQKITSLILCMCLIWSAAESIVASANTEESTPPVSTESQAADPQPLESQLSSFLLEKVDLQHAVEIVDTEDSAMNELTIKQDDGSFMLYSFAEDIKYEDENGDIQFKDTNIVEQTDPVTEQEGFEYTNGSNDICVDFSKDADTGVKISDTNNEITLTPISEDNTSKPAGEATEVSTGDNATESAFTYENAFGKGTRLEYSPQLNGIKENIVLDKYTGQNTFDFFLDTHGDRAELIDGQIVAIYSTETGKPVSALAPLFAYDSADDGIGTDSAHYTEDCTYSLAKEADGRYKLTVVVSEEWLTAPTTVYPVTIDPTIEHTGNIVTGMDCALYSGTPDGVFNTATTNSVGRATGDFATSPYKIGRAMFKYALPSEVMYTEVLAAKYFFFEVSKRTTQSYIRAYMINSVANGWNSGIATWNKYSTAYDTSTYSRKLIDGSEDWYWFGIPAIVQKWVNGTNANRGIMLVSEDEGVANSWRSFCSFRHGTSANRPYGAIQYQADVEAPVITSVTQSPTTWTNGSVKLTVNATDNAGVKEYSFDNGSNWQSDKTMEYTVNTSNIKIKAKDFKGNISAVTTVNITTIDKTLPVITSVTKSPTGWTKGNVTLTVNTTDTGSGVSKYYFDGVENTAGKSKTYTANKTGIKVTVKDAAGNVSVVTTVDITNIDTTAPIITSVTGNPTAWTKGPVTLTVNATDTGSGISTTDGYNFENLSSTKWQGKTKTYTANVNGIKINVRDPATNSSATTTINITKIDGTPPVIESIENDGTTVTVNATDSQSGIKDYSFDNGATWQTDNWADLDKIPIDLKIQVRDNMGWVASGSGVAIYDVKTDPEGWTNGSVTATVTASNAKSYSFDGGETWQSSNKYIIPENGAYEIIAKNANGDTDIRTIEIENIDKEEPVIESIDYKKDDDGNTVVTVIAVDEYSGMQDYAFETEIGGDLSWQEGNSKTFSSEPPANLRVFARDLAQNRTSNEVTITSVTQEPDQWTNQPCILRINATSLTSTITEYSFDGGETWQTNNFKTYTGYEEDIQIVAKAANGEIGRAVVPTVLYDDTPPSIVAIESTTNEQGHPIVRVTAEDEHSGIKDYSFDNGVTWQTENIKRTYTILPPNLKVVVRDNVGHQSSSSLLVSGITQSPDTWTTEDVIVTVQAVTGTGTTITGYSFDGGETWKSSNKKIFTEYESDVAIMVKNSAGNTCLITLPQIYIDREEPEIGLSVAVIDLNYPTVNVDATDYQSGIGTLKWAEGEHDAAYFSSNGTVLNFSQDENSFNGVFDGVYTVYAKDLMGHETVETIKAERPEEPPLSQDDLLTSGSTEHPVYGEFYDMVYPAELAKYLVVSEQTPALSDVPEWDESQDTPPEQPDHDALMRDNISEWIALVTLGERVPLFDANDCEVAIAYDFTYQTKEPDGSPTTVSGHIIVSLHLNDTLFKIVLNETFDREHFDTENTYYYFTDRQTAEYKLYSMDESGTYSDCATSTAITESEFSEAKQAAFDELKARDLEWLGYLAIDNKNQLTNIYNILTMTKKDIEETYGTFSWEVDYESMAQFLLQQELCTEDVTYDEMQKVEILDELLVYDENDVAFARAYNYLRIDGDVTTSGHILLSTHTKQKLLLDYEANACLPVDFEKAYYLHGTLYFYDNSEYYDVEGKVLDYNPREQVNARMAAASVVDENDSLAQIDDLYNVIEKHVDETQGDVHDLFSGGLDIMAAATVNWPFITQGVSITDNNQQIFTFEHMLTHNGYFSGAIDYTYDVSTQVAVQKLQKANNLSTHGIPYPETVKALAGDTGVRIANTKNTYYAADYAIQYLLSVRYGIDLGTLDGKFGAKTTAAVKKFQKWKGIGDDGQVGMTTWKYLLGSPIEKHPESTTESVKTVNDGVYHLKTGFSGYSLDMNTKNSTLNQYKHNGNLNQQWKLVYHSNGYYTIESVYSPGKRVRMYKNITDTMASTATLDDTFYWQIAEVSKGIYKIVSKTDAKKALTVKGNAAGNSKAIICDTYSGNTGQKWAFSSSGIECIIVVPGIMGSELFDGDGSTGYKKGTKLWNPEPADLSAPGKIYPLAFKSNGTANYPSIYAGGTKGASNVYSTLISRLESFFLNKKVYFFPYDWRKSCSDGAKDLENFINSKGFSKSVLVTHSMGGLVASHYLARGSSQRVKISKFIALGTPFLGTPQLLNVHQNGGALGSMKEDFYLKISGAIPGVMYNMPSTYELMPNKYYFSVANQKYTKYIATWQSDYASTKEALKRVKNFNIDLLTRPPKILCKSE